MFGVPPQIRREELARVAERLARPVALLLSLALLVVVVLQAQQADWALLSRSTSLSVWFWSTLVVYYLLSPLCEWLIYSRLWGFELNALPALLRKFVSNELLLDYLGDVQFLAWAHARSADRTSPFGAVKDVTILSALSGNAVTLIQIVFAWPYVAQGLAGTSLRTIFVSLTVVVGISSLILAFGKRLFSHPPRTLLWIAAVLALRSVGAMTLCAVLWHILMPQASLSALFVLATLRMMVSRLPLVPSKDLLFAGLAVVVFGKGADISDAASIIAALVLVIHVLAGSFLAVMHVASVRIKRG